VFTVPGLTPAIVALVVGIFAGTMGCCSGFFGWLGR